MILEKSMAKGPEAITGSKTILGIILNKAVVLPDRDTEKIVVIPDRKVQQNINDRTAQAAKQIQTQKVNMSN